MFVIKIENIYNQHEPILVQCDDYTVDGDMLCHGDTVEVLDREEDVCDIPVCVVH